MLVGRRNSFVFFFQIAELGNSKMENRNSKLEIRKSGAETRGGRALAMGAFRETKPYEATGLNAIIVKEIS